MPKIPPFQLKPLKFRRFWIILEPEKRRMAGENMEALEGENLFPCAPATEFEL